MKKQLLSLFSLSLLLVVPACSKKESKKAMPKEKRTINKEVSVYDVVVTENATPKADTNEEADYGNDDVTTPGEDTVVL